MPDFGDGFALIIGVLIIVGGLGWLLALTDGGTL